MNEMKTAHWKVAQDEAEEESKVVRAFRSVIESELKKTSKHWRALSMDGIYQIYVFK